MNHRELWLQVVTKTTRTHNSHPKTSKYNPYVYIYVALMHLIHDVIHKLVQLITIFYVEICIKLEIKYFKFVDLYNS